MGVPLIDRYAQLRLASGMSMRALARKSGVSFQALSKWEQGGRGPLLLNFEAALNTLGYELCIKKREDHT